MHIVTAFMNVYRNGHFHRRGKPHMFDRHGGDLYPTREAAYADRDQSESAGYVATVGPISWPEPVDIRPNGPDSKPIPLSLTRLPAEVFDPKGPSQLQGMRPLLAEYVISPVSVSELGGDTSLETSEREALPYPAKQAVEDGLDPADQAAIERINQQRKALDKFCGYNVRFDEVGR